ncbi:MAG: ABC transporter substrate-binding protein, partial [Chloroflexota bacterium]
MKKLTLIVILLLSIAVTPVTAQDDLTDVSVFLPFIPNIQFAPMYVAIEKGYFEDAGLNVTLEYGSEPDGLELIATGDLDYGVFGGEQVILARSGERPVVFIYEWYQRNPIAIVVPLEAGEETIATPEALAELTVGVPGRFGATYSSLTALLAAAELTEADIDLQEIGFNAPDVVCVGGVDAAAVYINNEPLQIRNRAEAGDCGDVADVDVIPVADFADLVSNGLVASEAKIADDPEQVQAFVTAFDRAMTDSVNNPAEAYMLSVPHIEGLPYENVDVFEAAAADAQNDADALRDALTPEEFL